MALLECAKLCFRFGEASLLASCAITPALKPNHKKPHFPAIHAHRPTPGSKLPTAAKREQALALEKRCGTTMPLHVKPSLSHKNLFAAAGWVLSL